MPPRNNKRGSRRVARGEGRVGNFLSPFLLCVKLSRLFDGLQLICYAPRGFMHLTVSRHLKHAEQVHL